MTVIVLSDYYNLPETNVISLFNFSSLKNNKIADNKGLQKYNDFEKIEEQALIVKCFLTIQVNNH